MAQKAGQNGQNSGKKEGLAGQRPKSRTKAGRPAKSRTVRQLCVYQNVPIIEQNKNKVANKKTFANRTYVYRKCKKSIIFAGQDDRQQIMKTILKICFLILNESLYNILA